MAKLGGAQLGEHRHGTPAQVIAEIERACVDRGIRFTDLRRRVFELIVWADRPMKAYELLDLLKSEREGAAPPTVYRALDFLLENHFIHKLESINAFVGCHHPVEAHTVPFFICDTCGRATEFCDSAVARYLNDHAEQLGFTPHAQSLEVHGVCKTCRNA